MKSFSFTLLSVLLGLSVAALSSIFLLYHNGYLHSASVFFQHNQAVYIPIQIGLLSLCIFFWPSFIRFVGKKQQWSIDAIDYFSNQWWRFLLLWLAIETLCVLPQLF